LFARLWKEDSWYFEMGAGGKKETKGHGGEEVKRSWEHEDNEVCTKVTKSSLRI